MTAPRPQQIMRRFMNSVHKQMDMEDYVALSNLVNYVYFSST